MLGERNSEYAVMINENPKLESVMNGQPFKAANFAYTFRVNLFAEHLGVDPKNKILADPLSDEFLNLVRNTAKNNIVGHVVEFPLHFLEKENLGISFFSVENIVPEKNFT